MGKPAKDLVEGGWGNVLTGGQDQKWHFSKTPCFGLQRETQNSDLILPIYHSQKWSDLGLNSRVENRDLILPDGFRNMWG